MYTCAWGSAKLRAFNERMIMSKSMRWSLFLATILFSVSSLAKAANNDPLNDPDVQKTLRAMADASTWYHPDLFGEFAGMRRYVHHDYAGALKYFKIGAYYADKLSQLSIGLMYVNGEGVEKDPLTGYAWLSVAAERKYPEFVATRDRIKASLTPAQLQQAQPILANLEAKYGDAVAKHRLIVQLHQGQMNITGSHTGFDSGVENAAAKQNCSGQSVLVGGEAVPQAGCAGFNLFASERWDPKLYFQARDAQWQGTVTVGAVKETGAAATKTKPAAPTTDAKH